MRPGIVVVFAVLSAQRAYGQPAAPEPTPPVQPSEPVPPVVAPPAQPGPPAGAPAPAAPAGAPAYYPPPPPAPQTVQQPVQVQRQRPGLFVVGDLALAGHSSSRDGIGSVTGGGLNVRLGAGVMVMPHLALFLGASYFESASVTIEDANGNSLDTDKLTISASSFFFGGRIYTPSDFYFEGTIGTLKHTAKDSASGVGFTSDVGALGLVGLGKEWLLLSGLTLGLGGRIGVGSVPAKDGGPDPTVVHLDLCISLGYSGG